MILIYTNKKTERLQYICSHVFKQTLGVDFELCIDIDYFNNFDGGKLNYSELLMDDVVSVYPHNLLFENVISPQTVEVFTYENMPVCFRNQVAGSAFPFDVFAACFFFLSRYEEYLPHEKDVHHRYEAKESLAYKHDFLHLAVVDRWIKLLADELKKKYSDISFAQSKSSFILTYDIDLAYAYKHKGFLLNAAGFIRSLFKCKFADIKNRANVLLDKTTDSYDTFDYLSSLHQKYELKPCYFFLVAQNRSRYDKNTRTDNKAFQNLIQNLSVKADIGLHTSYYVMDNPQKVKHELACLQNILEKPMVKNRYHYLRFSLPESYQLLLSNGVEEDYSMGYVHHIGFRAGTCKPFYFFDLKENKTTKLLVYPLLFMENAFMVENISQIKSRLMSLVDEVLQYNGTLVSLFHNQSFGDDESGGQWKKIYEELLQKITNL